MIHESVYWKEPLLQIARRLKKLKSVDEITERRFVQLEKDIFIGFFSVRKLIESKTKISDTNKQKNFEITYYKIKEGKKVNIMNNHKIDYIYDLDLMLKERKNIWIISSYIIHSFIFIPVITENGGLHGLFFTSDKLKDEKIYFIHIDQVINIFELIGKDYPARGSFKKNTNTGEYTYKVE